MIPQLLQYYHHQDWRPPLDWWPPLVKMERKKDTIRSQPEVGGYMIGEMGLGEGENLVKEQGHLQREI